MIVQLYQLIVYSTNLKLSTHRIFTPHILQFTSCRPSWPLHRPRWAGRFCDSLVEAVFARWSEEPHTFTRLSLATAFLRINVLLDIVFKLLFSAEQEGGIISPSCTNVSVNSKSRRWWGECLVTSRHWSPHHTSHPPHILRHEGGGQQPVNSHPGQGWHWDNLLKMFAPCQAAMRCLSCVLCKWRSLSLMITTLLALNDQRWISVLYCTGILFFHNSKSTIIFYFILCLFYHDFYHYFICN